MASLTLIINGTVVTPGNPDRVLENGAVLVDGEFIADVGDSDTLLQANPRARVIDAAGRIVMPGLINAHMHLYSTLACGLAGEPAHNFPEILKKLWWKLDRALDLEDIYYSALVPYHRCITSGTTTIIDHHASPYAVKGSLNVLADAARVAGIRSAFCYEVSDRDGVTIRDEGLQENASFIEVHSGDDETFIKGMFGLHASLTLNEDTLKEAVKLASALKAGIHVHAAEDLSDQEDSLARYNKRVVSRFHDAGGLSPKAILAHCIHVDEEERRLLKESGTFVVHNPESNMNNAVGAADVLGMLGEGIHVGLGTDGMTSDMRQEARIAMLLQRQAKGDPTVGFGEAVDMLVRENARFASELFGTKLGVIEKGAQADIIIVEHYPFTPIKPENWYGHFLFGVQPSIVTHTMAAGNLLMAERQVLTVDLADTARRSSQRSPETWKRFADMKEQS